MKSYRILEHPEGCFNPQSSTDGGLTWRLVHHWEYSCKKLAMNSLGLAKKNIEADKEMDRKYAIKRVVYQE